MAFCLSKLSRDRPHGVHPDLVRVVERAIQITPQDLWVPEGLRTRERQAALVARRQPDHALSGISQVTPSIFRAGWRQDHLAVGGLFPGRNRDAGRGARARSIGALVWSSA